MSDLENFLHNQHIMVPELVRVAVAHYQFETIHPFLDGNGRIGRLLITLFLISCQLIDMPLLYLSTYFEKNKSLYYDSLTLVRTRNDLSYWLKYFLKGIAQVSDEAFQTLSQVLALKASIEKDIPRKFGRRTSSAMALVKKLFLQPIIYVSDAKKACNISHKAANELVADFQKAGLEELELSKYSVLSAEER